MKKLWPNKKSHQLWFLGALMLPLTACGGTVNLVNEPGTALPKFANGAVYIADAPSGITVTKTTNKDTGAVSWNAGTPGAAEFTFTAFPGSDAVNIVGVKITRDIIDGKDVTGTEQIYKNIFIYVQSGYTCTNQVDLAKLNQSCDPASPQSRQATGLTSVPISYNLASGLVPLVIAKNDSVSRVTDFEFIGTSARNEKVIIKAANVGTTAVKVGDQ